MVTLVGKSILKSKQNKELSQSIGQNIYSSTSQEKIDISISKNIDDSRLDVVTLQLDITPGDLINNTNKIINGYKQNVDADLIVINELAISGYIPLDELLKNHYIDAVNEQIEKLKALTLKNKPAIIVGDVFLDRDGNLFDAAYVIKDGEIKNIIKKQCLIDYDVFRESRYFTKGEEVNNIVQIKGFNLLLLVCEDAWRPEIVSNKYAGKVNVDFIVVINASPYEVNKLKNRHNVLSNIAQQFNAPAVYVHLVGGVDGIVFDGRSFLVNKKGEVINQLKFLEEDMMMISLNKVESSGGEHFSFCEIDSSSIYKNQEIPQEQLHLPRNQEVYDVIQKSFSDFMIKNNLKGAIIGLSGGIDSAMSAVIASDTLGAENVLCVSMPSKYTSDLSKDIIKRLVKNLGVNFLEIPIEGMFDNIASNLFNKDLTSGQYCFNKQVTEENLQSRIRGIALMSLSNDRDGYVTLCNGNKSELATGYFTLYGDSCGAFNLLKDLYKTDLFALANWRNESYTGSYLSKNGINLNVIPQGCIKRAPSAELRVNQKDEDKLLPYILLDKILKDIIENNVDYNDLITKFKQKDVDFVLKLLKSSEFKRKQAVIGPKLGKKSFGSEWQYLITNKFKK